MNKRKSLIALLCSTILLLLCVDNAGAVAGEYVFINTEDDGDSYLGVCSYNGLVYVACGTDGLRIYNATSYNLITAVNDGANYYDVDVDGNLIFIAGGGTGILCYKFFYTNDTTFTLTLNSTAYNATFDEYYDVFAEPSGTYVYACVGAEGIFGYTYDYDAGLVYLAGSQLDDDGSAGYNQCYGAETWVYVACGGDGLRAYTWDGANFVLYSTVDNSTDNYYDVVMDGSGYIHTANGVDGTYVYTDTGVFNLEYNRTDSLGDSYLRVWTNDTIVHYACGSEGLRAYTNYDGATMEYLDEIAPVGRYCTAVTGDADYVYFSAVDRGLLWFTFNLISITSPSVTTTSASGLTPSIAILNGLLTDDGGVNCSVWFEWGADVSYGNTTSNQTKTTGQSFSQSITGLTPSTTYHYRAVANNTNSTVYGADAEFTTVGRIEVNWTGIFDGIGRMFTGGNYTDSNGDDKSVTGIFGGGQDTMALFGLFIFLILFLLTALFGMGILVGSVVIIPSVFAVIGYIPELRVVVAIIAGLIFGMGVNRFVRR